ncbi:CRISPR-associated endonuclease Cas2 [Pectinatus frisingensis]|uniref:CRISPR-associated endonuclease Cas2 n=1 Tax=Pectinatus frisingensis TaxID=865 RepID=UPI0018C58701|nr:CRISPR-associated endonuclease Cas2 [Pectinatus frisingensis]
MDNNADENEFVAIDDRRYIILAIYDIVNDKRRSKMVKCLEGFGVRVQKSAFEAYLTKKSYEKLMNTASHIIDIKEDSLRVYLLASHTSVRSWGKGHDHVEDVIIF